MVMNMIMTFQVSLGYIKKEFNEFIHIFWLLSAEISIVSGRNVCKVWPTILACKCHINNLT